MKLEAADLLAHLLMQVTMDASRCKQSTRREMN